MNFFDMGFGEILLILIVALIFWGPDRLPEIARTLGRWMANIRKAGRDLTTQITRDMEDEEQSARTHHLIEDAKKRISSAPGNDPGRSQAEASGGAAPETAVETPDAAAPETPAPEDVNEKRDGAA